MIYTEYHKGEYSLKKIGLMMLLGFALVGCSQSIESLNVNQELLEQQQEQEKGDQELLEKEQKKESRSRLTITKGDFVDGRTLSVWVKDEPSGFRWRSIVRIWFIKSQKIVNGR